MAAQDNLSPQQLFHGTKEQLEPGTGMVYPGQPRANGTKGPPRPYNTYMTEDLEIARGYAERAHGAGNPRVYEVRTFGHYEYDPDQAGPSYRSRDSLRVVREIW